MIRVQLPGHLRELAGIEGLAEVALGTGATARELIESLEAQFPTLRGTIRERGSGARRPYVRFFACGRDLSHESLDDPLPEAVAEGQEPFVVLGALSGG